MRPYHVYGMYRILNFQAYPIVDVLALLRCAVRFALHGR